MKIEIKKMEPELPTIKDLAPGTQFKIRDSSHIYTKLAEVINGKAVATRENHTLAYFDPMLHNRPSEILGTTTKPPTREFTLTLSEEEAKHVRDAVGNYPSKIIGRELYLQLTDAIK